MKSNDIQKKIYQDKTNYLQEFLIYGFWNQNIGSNASEYPKNLLHLFIFSGAKV